MYQPTYKGRSNRERLQGQTVLITGAGSGFGYEAAMLFAGLGAIIIAVDIHLPAAQHTLSRICEAGGTGYARQADVGDAGQMQALADWVSETTGAPDIVINNAGIGMSGSFLDTTLADWQHIMNVNLWGVIHGSRLFARLMVEAGKPGVIVNVASMAAYTPSRTIAAYATTKAAVRMLSDCIRGELQAHDIHVATICPGFSSTGIIDNTRFVGASDSRQVTLRTRVNRLYKLRSLPPRTIAEAILRAVDRREAEIAVGIEARGMLWLSRISPTVSRLLAKLDPTP